MASCWSCGQDAGPEAFCAACGKVQPPRAAEGPFAVLGLTPAFDVEPAEVERRYRDLQRKLHPDRFAQKPAQERRASLERATQVNEAYRILRDPVRRAEALLAAAGVPLAPEGSPASRPADPELLMEILELRESLEDARRAHDLGRVATLASGVRSRRDQTLAEIGSRLHDGAPDAVVPLLHRLRYFARFLEEAAVIEEATA